MHTAAYSESELVSDDAQVHEVLNTKLAPKTIGKNPKRSAKKKTLQFNFDATELVDVISIIAAEQEVNIILPMGANAINAKVTLHMDQAIPIEQAWILLHTLLEMTGYSLIQKHDTYVIVKIGPTINREPSPIFIGIDPAKLPDYEKRIIYLYYLNHIKVPKPGTEGSSELDAILKEVLPAGALIRYDPATNAVILHDNASNIKSVMSIIKELDKPGFQESFDIIRLRYAQSDLLAELFNKSILGVMSPQARLSIRKPSEAQYFPQGTRVFSEPRSNSLFVLGSAQAIERIKDFIIQYLDVELGSGKSILHTYQLQYLDAEPFARILDTIIKSANPGGTQQSRPATGGPGGPERFFEDVIIATDKPTRTGPPTGGEYFGGNKLIIAARNDDWERIRKLIEQLDTPQPQVIIEVLIADLQLRDDRILGDIMRNPAVIPLPNISNSVRPLEFQSAQIGQVATSVAPGGVHALSTIDADLDLFASGLNPNVDIPLNVSTAFPGSTIVTFSDHNGSTYDILQILQSYGQTKILSHPHVIATNNKKAVVSIGETRLVQAEAVGSAGGATTARNTEIKANLTVGLTPRISSANTVSLTIEINIDEFISTNQSDANRNTRTVKTSANVESNAILALGGLIKVNVLSSVNETPLLSKIPILGWFFKRRQDANIKTDLTVFVRPTIIQPRLRGGIGAYTTDYISVARDYAREGMLFDSLRDPITRWFFKTGVDADDALRVFLDQNLEKEKVFDGEQPVKNKRRRSRKKVVKACPPTPCNEQPACTTPCTTQPQGEERALQVKKLVEHEQNPLLTTKQQVGEKVLNT
jgi:general secretion pathway protein D